MNKKFRLTPSYFFRVLLTGVVLAFLSLFIADLFKDGLYPLASILSAIFVFIGMVYLRPRFTPMRWLGFGIVLSMLFTLYPILYTVYISVTNMGSGHLMSKNQAISKIEALQYLPEEGETYSWAAFKTSEDHYALWLVSEDGKGWFAPEGEEMQNLVSGQNGVGELDENGIPLSIEGYERLERKFVIPVINELSLVDFGLPPKMVRIHSLGEAVESQALYEYDSENDVMVNQQTGEVYEPVQGTFTSGSGETLTPGYIVFFGGTHFSDFMGNEGLPPALIKNLRLEPGFYFLLRVF